MTYRWCGDKTRARAPNEFGVDFVEVHQALRIGDFDEAQFDLYSARDVRGSPRRYKIDRECLTQTENVSTIGVGGCPTHTRLCGSSNA